MMQTISMEIAMHVAIVIDTCTYTINCMHMNALLAIELCTS